MLLVNLVPALPLDGGRMVRAILCRFISYSAATKGLIRIGYALGAALIGVSLLSACRGELHFAPAFAGVYLLYAAALEGKQGSARYITQLIGRREKISKKEILPVEIWDGGRQLPLTRLMQKFSAGKYHLVCVLSDDGLRPDAVLDEEAICRAVLDDGCRYLGDCIQKSEAQAASHKSIGMNHFFLLVAFTKTMKLLNFAAPMSACRMDTSPGWITVSLLP